MAIFISCAGSKIQEKAPAQFEKAFYEEQGDFINLYLPVTAIQANRISLDSVYFRGRKAALKQDERQPGMYSAKFNTGKEDMILSSDPREEYKNKLPETPVEVPFKIRESEAILVFKENDEVKHYKISGILNRGEN